MSSMKNTILVVLIVVASIGALPFHYPKIKSPFPQLSSEPDLLSVEPVHPEHELPISPVINEDGIPDSPENLESELQFHLDTFSSQPGSSGEPVTPSSQYIPPSVSNETELQVEELISEPVLTIHPVTIELEPTVESSTTEPELQVEELTSEPVLTIHPVTIELEPTVESSTTEPELAMEPVTVSSVYIPPPPSVSDEIEIPVEPVTHVGEISFEKVSPGLEFLVPHFKISTEPEISAELLVPESEFHIDPPIHTTELSGAAEDTEPGPLLISATSEPELEVEPVTLELELVAPQVTAESATEEPATQELELKSDLALPSTEHLLLHFPETNEIEPSVQPVAIAHETPIDSEDPVPELPEFQTSFNLITPESELTSELEASEPELPVELTTPELDLPVEPITEELELTVDLVTPSSDYLPPLFSEESELDVDRVTTEMESEIHPVTSASEPAVHAATFELDQPTELQTLAADTTTFEPVGQESKETLEVVTPSSIYLLPLFETPNEPELKVALISTEPESVLDPETPQPTVLQTPDSNTQVDPMTSESESPNNIDNSESEEVVHPVTLGPVKLSPEYLPPLPTVSEQSHVAVEPVTFDPELLLDTSTHTSESPMDPVDQELELLDGLHTSESEILVDPVTPHADLTHEEDTLELAVDPVESVTEIPSDLATPSSEYLPPISEVSEVPELEAHPTASEPADPSTPQPESALEPVTQEVESAVETVTLETELPVDPVTTKPESSATTETTETELNVDAVTLSSQYIPPDPSVSDSESTRSTRDSSWTTVIKNWFSKIF